MKKYWRNCLKNGHWNLISIELTNKELNKIIEDKNLIQVSEGSWRNEEETYYLNIRK